MTALRQRFVARTFQVLIALAAVNTGALLGNDTPNLLWRPIPWDVKINPTAQAIRYQTVAVDLKLLLSSATKRLSLLVPDGEQLIVSKIRDETIGKRAYVWHGIVEGDEKSIATFSVVNQTLSADIVTSRGKIFRVRFVANGVHLVEELDRARFPPEAGLFWLFGQPSLPRAPSRQPFALDIC